MIDRRTLLLRSNRALGSSLLENNLISIEDLEFANKKLLEIIQAGDFKQASILNILAFEMKKIEEAVLIDFIMENDGVGLIDLKNYDVTKGVGATLDYNMCWATWTLPFNFIDNIYFVATSYYLSLPVRKYWTLVLGENIIWYAINISSLSEALERLGNTESE